MTVQTETSLARVWGIAAAIFVFAAAASRALAGRPSPVPSYVAGIVGLLAIGVALVLSWRRVGVAGAHTPATRRVLRVAIALGAVLWLGAMLFPLL